MTKTLFAIACFFVAASATAADDINLTASKTSVNIDCKFGSTGACTTKTATFHCDRTLTGQCHYIVMASNCRGQNASKDASKDGRKNADTIQPDEIWVCETRKLSQFDLHAGESKALASLPANFTYCADVNPIAGLQACMAKPAPQ